jgi:hypothetical protein
MIRGSEILVEPIINRLHDGVGEDWPEPGEGSTSHGRVYLIEGTEYLLRFPWPVWTPGKTEPVPQATEARI